MSDTLPMPTVRISRVDAPGARVEDGTVGALSARFSGQPLQGDDDGSVLVPFPPDTSPEEALREVEHKLDGIERLSDWRSRLGLSVL